jgi:hypothetical protein
MKRNVFWAFYLFSLSLATFGFMHILITAPTGDDLVLKMGSCIVVYVLAAIMKLNELSEAR